MPTVGLIVEGVYDEAVIPVFWKRCRRGVKIVSRKCRGLVTGKFPGIVAELHRSYRIERVLVVSDADGEDPAQLVRTIKGRLVESYRFAVVPIIIVQKLEAWLIADPNALKNVLGVTRNFSSPERISDPKAELQKLFSRKTAYTPETARRIAEEIDLDVLRKRCPRFSVFRATVLDS
jgi:hypothetical protein